jgi:integrase
MLEKRCEGKHSEDLVFGNGGAVFRNSSFRRRFFDRAVKAMLERDANFPEITPHDLRQTAASLAASAGANVKAVQRMLGHGGDDSRRLRGPVR